MSTSCSYGPLGAKVSEGGQVVMSTQKQRTIEFKATIDRLNRQIGVLSGAVNTSLGFNPEQVNYSHIGTALHIAELLDEVLEFCNVKTD